MNIFTKIGLMVQASVFLAAVPGRGINRSGNLMRLAVVIGVLGVTVSFAAGATVQYAISPGSSYVYFPSQRGPGIPGGVPNAYELQFGVTGTFSLNFSKDMTSVSFVDAALGLTGNEAVQSDPSNNSP